MILKQESLLADAMVAFALLVGVAFLLLVFSSARLP
jgi:hypothetical protein